MAHWRNIIDNGLISLSYERLINNFENEVRKLFVNCGIEIETSCFEFYKTKQTVDTASSEQVRQPIYKGGLDYWSNYKEYLPSFILDKSC